MPGAPSDEGNIAAVAIRFSDIPAYRIVQLLTNLCYSKEDVEGKQRSSLSLIKAFRIKQKEIQRYNKQQKRIFNRLFSNVAWPTQPKLVNEDEWSRLYPKRQVNHDSEGDSGSFYSKKNKAEVEYESQLEYRFCMYLEQLDSVQKYMQQPINIRYSLANKDHTYYPDFLVMLRDGRCIIVEIKSHNHMGFYRNIVKWTALQEFCLKYRFGYLIIEDSRSLNDYIYMEVDKFKTETLLKHVTDNQVTWSDYRKIRETLSLDWKEATSIILQHDLMLSISPFRLSKSPTSFADFVEKHKQLTVYQSKVKDANETAEQRNKSGEKKVTPKKQSNTPQITIKPETNNEAHLLNSYNRWDSEEDAQLTKEFNMGMKIEQIALSHKRKISAIKSRLKKLRLITQ
jgi:TnsA endonuclease N terminal.